jgi:hypothetical protein
MMMVMMAAGGNQANERQQAEELPFHPTLITPSPALSAGNAAMFKLPYSLPAFRGEDSHMTKSSIDIFYHRRG